METPEPQPFLKQHFRKVFLASLLVLVALAAWGHRPAWSAFKSWRAERLAAEAREFAQAGDWDEVHRTATASLQNAGSLEAFRLLTEAAEHTGDSRVLKLAASLFLSPDATPADLARALKIILDAGDSLNASRLASTLDRAELAHPPVRHQAVRGLLMVGNFREAIALADDPALTPRDPALDLLLARGFADRGTEKARDATAERLRLLLHGEDRDLALQAVQLLASLPDHWINEDLATLALERFQGDPDLAGTDQLHLDLFHISLQQVPAEELIEQSIARHREANLTPLVEWLMRLGEVKRIVDLTDPDTVSLDVTLFQLRAHALGALGRLEQLESELEAPPVHIPEPLLLSARASLATRMKKESQAILLWRKAFDAAKLDRSRNWFYPLATVAQRGGDTDRQMEALAQGIEHPLGTPPSAPSLAPLFQWLLERNDTDRLLEVSYALLRREPNNPVLINNYLYLRAVHGNPSESDADTLRKLAEAFPDQAAFRHSLALTLLRIGNPQGALEELGKLASIPAELSPSGQAIYSKALEALSKPDEAAALAATIDWNALTKAEQELLMLSPQP